MADNTTGSPQPAANAAQGKSQRAASDAPGLPKRQPRNRKQNIQQIPKMDGTVSDSVANPTASPRSKKAVQQRHNINPTQNGNVGNNLNGHKTRPVSFGGNMLPTTPAKEQAYAGPTFQASPAPSTLPVPRFFSKSVPNVAGLQERMEGEKTPEQQASPEPDTVAPVPRDATLSPLDVFFKADKAEKDRRSSSNMLSPELAARSRPPPATEPRNPFISTGKGAFLSELDGDLPSPKTVPQSEPHAPAERPHSSPGVRDPSTFDEQQREAMTKSLKDLLFQNATIAPATQNTPNQPHPRTQSAAHGPPADFQTPSPFQRSASGPTTPAPGTDQQNHYSLHYGNRNLSPLFKAARDETPARPSGLRQQVADDPIFRPVPSTTQSQPDHPHLDSNDFSRRYLDEHIRSTYAPPQSSQQAPPHTNGTLVSNPQPGAGAGQGASPRTGAGGSRDVKSMEDDLRRMLKLNVMK